MRMVRSGPWAGPGRTLVARWRTGQKRAERLPIMRQDLLNKTNISVKIVQKFTFYSRQFQKFSRASPPNPHFIN